MIFRLRGLSARCYLSCLLIVGLMGCSGSTPTAPGTTGGAPQGTAALPAACEGAILPTTATIESGEYTPLSRPLYIYVNKKALAKPEVAAFVKMAMYEEGQELVPGAGYIKLNDKVLKEQQAKLEETLKDITPDEKMGEVIAIDGSSTVFPISVVVAESFQKKHPGVKVAVGKSGTGGGFKKFVVGETDISNASRLIEDGEIAKCKENGVEFLELKVAIDGLTVVVNPGNNWCSCLTIADLKKLWESKSEVKKWKDLNPEWPDEEIVLYGPDTDSGTFDYFVEVVCQKKGNSRTDYTPSTEDNVLVRGVAGDTYALGYFGYSYYDKNRETLKAVAIFPPKSESAAALPAEKAPPAEAPKEDAPQADGKTEKTE